MMLSNDIFCDCGMMIMKSYDSGKTKIRSKVVVVEKDGTALAVCRKCSKEIEIPILVCRSTRSKIRHYIARPDSKIKKQVDI